MTRIELTRQFVLHVLAEKVEEIMSRGMIYILCPSPIDVCHNDRPEDYNRRVS